MRRTWMFLFLLGGCKTEDEPTIEVLSELDAWAPAAIEVVPTVGSGTVEVPIRLVNAYAAAVPGSVATVDVSGTTAAAWSNTIRLDGMGYGIVKVDTTGPEAFEVAVTASSDGAQAGASAVSYRVDGTLPRFAVGRQIPLDGLPADPSLSALGTGGMVVASADEIWWVPSEPGHQPYRTADLSSDVAGMWSGHIDSDGILDLVAWTGPVAVALRGHTAGGFAWGGAWQSDKGDVIGVAISDVDGDRNADLTVGVSGENVGYAQILLGDGVWGFEPIEALEVPFGLLSITAGDDGHDGKPDVDLLNANSGTLRRFTLGDAGWAGGSPPELSGYQASPGAYVMPLADLNGDDADEVIVVGAPGASTQDLVFYIVATQVRYPQYFESFHPALADMNADGATDILAFQDDETHMIRWEASQLKFIDQTISGTGSTGPAVAADFDGDTVLDLAVATEGITLFPGVLEEGAWSMDNAGWRAYSLNMSSDPLIFDVNEDGLPDIVGFTTDAGALVLSGWLLTETDEGGQQLATMGDITFGAGMEALGIAQCGGTIFALTTDGAGNDLHVVEPTGAGSSWALDLVNSTSAAGTLLTCGDLGDGTPTAVVAVTSGAWTAYDTDLTQVSTGSVGAAQAIAVQEAPSGGDVVACLTAGCSIVTDDLDGDGTDEVITGGDTVTVEFAAATWDLGVPGRVSTADANGDGQPDVLVVDGGTGAVYIAAGLAGAVAPAVAWHTDRDVRGPMTLADLTGDGLPEWMMLDSTGRLVHTAATKETGVAEEGGDTGTP